MPRSDSLLFRALTPTGVKNIEWLDWERQMIFNSKLQATMASITGLMLGLYELLPTKSDGPLSEIETNEAVELTDDLRRLFLRLPAEYRPITTSHADLILLSMRFAAAMLLTNRGRSH